jgi:hypothetical protein
VDIHKPADDALSLVEPAPALFITGVFRDQAGWK